MNTYNFGDWVTILEVDDAAVKASGFINRAGQVLNRNLNGEPMRVRVKEKMNVVDFSLGKKYKVRPATVDEILTELKISN